MYMRFSVARSSSALIPSVATAIACRSTPPAPVAPPPPLSDSARAALAWVQSHAQEFAIADSNASAAERARLVALAGDARIVGVSELNEGTREFPNIIRRLLFSLADSA